MLSTLNVGHRTEVQFNNEQMNKNENQIEELKDNDNDNISESEAESKDKDASEESKDKDTSDMSKLPPRPPPLPSTPPPSPVLKEKGVNDVSILKEEYILKVISALSILLCLYLNLIIYKILRMLTCNNIKNF
jgi:hypothetical protein